ncbi:hypothetical protein [Nostoc sp.]|uniref:hypothetical protein n=1 Tax=Nostoc sp. TaxID=1180 RepID=UPI0035937B28
MKPNKSMKMLGFVPQANRRFSLIVRVQSKRKLGQHCNKQTAQKRSQPWWNCCNQQLWMTTPIGR